jgi:hypothetical protein
MDNMNCIIFEKYKDKIYDSAGELTEQVFYRVLIGKTCPIILRADRFEMEKNHIWAFIKGSIYHTAQLNIHGMKMAIRDYTVKDPIEGSMEQSPWSN